MKRIGEAMMSPAFPRGMHEERSGLQTSRSSNPEDAE